MGDSTSIWFVREVGEEFHIIDHYSNSGEGLRHYMKVLKDKGYEYASHNGPHDIDNREFGSDAKSRGNWRRKGTKLTGKPTPSALRWCRSYPLMRVLRQCAKSCRSVYSMRTSVAKALPTLRRTGKNGMTNAGAGKINHFTTTHHTMLTDSVILRSVAATSNV